MLYGKHRHCESYSSTHMHLTSYVTSYIPCFMENPYSNNYDVINKLRNEIIAAEEQFSCKLRQSPFKSIINKTPRVKEEIPRGPSLPKSFYDI